jgi:hypothetical protein
MKLSLICIGDKYMLVKCINGVDVPVVDYVHGELVLFDKAIIDRQKGKTL